MKTFGFRGGPLILYSHSPKWSLFCTLFCLFNTFLYRFRSSTIILILIEEEVYSNLKAVLINLFLREEFRNVTTKGRGLLERSCFLPKQFNLRIELSSIIPLHCLAIDSSLIRPQLYHYYLLNQILECYML